MQRALAGPRSTATRMSISWPGAGEGSQGPSPYFLLPQVAEHKVTLEDAMRSDSWSWPNRNLPLAAGDPVAERAGDLPRSRPLMPNCKPRSCAKSNPGVPGDRVGGWGVWLCVTMIASAASAPVRPGGTPDGEHALGCLYYPSRLRIAAGPTATKTPISSSDGLFPFYTGIIRIGDFPFVDHDPALEVDLP